MAETPDDIDALWDFSDPVASEAKFRQLGDSTVAMTQVARALGLQQKFDEACKVLDEVERRLPNEPTSVAVRYHLERGRIYDETGDSEPARANLEQARELAEAARLDDLAAEASGLLAAQLATDVPAPPPTPQEDGAPLEHIVDDVESREEAQAWAWLQLRQQRTGEDVLADLVARGWDEDEALLLIEAARRDPGPKDAGAGIASRYPRRGGIIGAIVNGIVGLATAIMGVNEAAADEQKRAQRLANGRCGDCGYDLHGSTDPCPNCGAKPIDASNSG